jgi:DNA-binding GntR family transcriptional regulator
LFSDIINGVYPADATLSEKLLMEKYSVSRAPIREALQQLTIQNFLRSIPRQGYKIIQPDDKVMSQLEAYRALLEPAFLRQYGGRITRTVIDELRTSYIAANELPPNAYRERWQYNCRFHLNLFAVSKNRYAYESLKNALYVQTIFYVRTRFSSSASLHAAIIDYLENDNIDMAAKILEADIAQLQAP